MSVYAGDFHLTTKRWQAQEEGKLGPIVGRLIRPEREEKKTKNKSVPLQDVDYEKKTLNGKKKKKAGSYKVKRGGTIKKREKVFLSFPYFSIDDNV